MGAFSLSLVVTSNGLAHSMAVQASAPPNNAGLGNQMIVTMGPDESDGNNKETTPVSKRWFVFPHVIAWSKTFVLF